MRRIADRWRCPARTRKGAGGFTLLEVLIAFAIGTTLTSVIYFFYLGLFVTDSKTREREYLNQVAEIELERMVRELQLAVEITQLLPQEISFRRPQVKQWSESGFEVNMDADARAWQTVTYKRVEVEPGRFALQRILGLNLPEELFQVDALDPDIFLGWVFPKGAEETPHEIPQMEVYRPGHDVKSAMERVALVRIRLAMTSGRDRIEIVTKAFLPPVYARIVQPFWNPN